MMRPLGIDHVVTRARDLDAMLAFYCEVLGCTIERRRDDLGLSQLRAGNALIDLVPVDGKLGAMGGAAPGVEGRNMDHLCLRIADFEVNAVRAHLKAHGVEPGEEGLRYGSTGEAISIYLSDPDGNALELRA
ncbi:MAG: VOC family protein [Brevundimonas sp.]|nr:MAG: VOC family protein [Brevundimonas sp.]